MDSAIITYYKKWKKNYLRKSEDKKIGKGFYVAMTGTGGSGTEVTTSEAHGYGMIIFSLMAGFDDSAKIYFDGMVHLFDLHRSTINTNLMSWIIDPVNGNSDGATDGDMDIAYALLLADNQWGSDGDINYGAKADSMLSRGIKGGDVRSSGSKRTKLGDWDDDPYDSRSSDWITDHFHTYYQYTKDPFWLQAADTVYSLIEQVSSHYSPTTGLMPDFIVGRIPEPADPNFLEDITDGDYAWNACRFPWRIAMDYAHYGTAEAKRSLNKILTWLKSTTNGNPSQIYAGYHLDGSQGRDADGVIDYPDMAFTAPFIAACVVDATHQEFLNAGWDIIKDPQGDYFGDSIGLLCLLFISGNWWKPEWSTAVATPPQATAKSGNALSAVIRNAHARVSCRLPAAGSVTVTVFDCSGTMIQEVREEKRKGFSTIDMKLPRVQNGMYVIKTAAPGFTKSIIVNKVN
jgi:endo-1,4-beta-D-glucanase Y